MSSIYAVSNDNKSFVMYTDVILARMIADMFQGVLYTLHIQTYYDIPADDSVRISGSVERIIRNIE